MDFYYCVLKAYKGLFKKKHIGNSHFFASPISKGEFLVLGLIGEFVKLENLLACVLIARGPLEHLEEAVDSQKEFFKGRFEVVEKLPCVAKDLGQGKYKVSFPRKGKFIKSDLAIAFEPEYSDSQTRMYSVAGEIEIFVGEKVTPQTAKMLALKKMAFIGPRAMFTLGR